MRAVIPRLRHRRLPIVLSVLALLAQLLLPSLHAQAWAQQNGDARLYAFCGAVSQNVARALSEQIAASIHARGDDGGAELLNGLQCPACAGLHAGHLAAPPAAGIVLLALTHDRPQGLALTAATLVQLVHLPPSQAPPQYS